MRFSEKGVEQCFKDFSIPLENVFKFFETYAKIDGRKYNGSQIFAMLDQDYDCSSQSMQETLVRISPDLIIAQSSEHTENLAQHASELSGKEVRTLKTQITPHIFDQISSEYTGKNVLILVQKSEAELLRNHHNQSSNFYLEAGQVIKLPNYRVSNELDRWILAELHQCLFDVDHGLQHYNLDGAIRRGIDFIEKLSNWYLRRSRRRFWENEMSSDKLSAYATLYEVLCSYLQMMAPFTPFITEELRKKLAAFSNIPQQSSSIHLSFWPFACHQYIDSDLIQEIAVVRKAIKLALFVRSKNKIAVKQPLQSLSIKIE